MPKKYKVSIIGTGSLGTAIAHLTQSNGHQISAYEKNNKTLKTFSKQINKKTNICNCLEDCIDKSEIIIPCLPSQALDQFYTTYINQKSINKKIISVSKGLFPKTGQTISQYLKNKIDLNNFMVFSGPTFADEIINQHPTNCTVSSQNGNNERIAKLLFNNHYFQITFNKNVITNEYNGILKNCYSITLGIITRLKYGMNTKSLTIIKIIEELLPFYKKLKLNTQSLYSLSFLGDFIATGLNANSRNFQIGFQLNNKPNTTHEGPLNIKQILKIAEKNKISLPILDQTNKIITKKTSPKTLVKYLLDK